MNYVFILFAIILINRMGLHNYFVSNEAKKKVPINELIYDVNKLGFKIS